MPLGHKATLLARIAEPDKGWEDRAEARWPASYCTDDDRSQPPVSGEWFARRVTAEATIPLRGPYDLAEVALMGFGHRDEHRFDGVMRLAFCTDGDLDRAVGVEVRQDGDALHLRIQGSAPDADAVARQVARVVSADHDGEAYARVCSADPVLARVHAAAPGFRPALFYSPYEALVWALLSARRSRSQGMVLRRRLSERLGTTFDVAGEPAFAVPGPSRLLELDALDGLPAPQVDRLHHVARAALAGDLAIDRLQALAPDEAMTRLQTLPGVGPFYSALVGLRACGLTDAMSVAEPRSREVVRVAYGFDHEPSDDEMLAIADRWRPFRTWALVALRAVGTRPGVL